MALLRDDPDFGTAIDRAARELGEQPAFIEKDYWVTQVLRALTASMHGGFVLKGGTSLSKGYGIIRRFSEDVDILLVPEAGQSASTVERRLRALTEDVASLLGVGWERARLPGRGLEAHRGDWVRYPTAAGRGLDLPITAEAVLLETRVGRNTEPSEMVNISTLLGKWSEIDPEEHEDLAPVRVRVLEPRRTLIEKLVAVHHSVSTWDRERLSQARFGRHYYDIYHLLDHRPTVAALRGDRDGFATILTDVERICLKEYKGFTPRPDGGYASSLAFNPERGSVLRAWLEESYRISMRLVAPSEVAPPTFEQVLRRVSARAAML